MSGVETVKSIYRTFGQGDLPGLLARLDPEVEWVTPASLPWSRGGYHGHDGVRSYFEAFLSHLDDPRVEPGELIGEGERVVALGWERARCRDTGRSFAARFAHTWTVRDGMVLRMEGVVDTATIATAFEPERAVA